MFLSLSNFLPSSSTFELSSVNEEFAIDSRAALVPASCFDETARPKVDSETPQLLVLSATREDAVGCSLTGELVDEL